MGFMDSSPEALAMNGGVEPCPSPHTTTTTFSVTPGARSSGFAALGVSVGYVLEAGIKGTLTMVDLSLPIQYSINTTTNNPARTPREDKELQVDLILTLLAGEISFYVALDAVITTIPIFEYVLANWHGLRIDFPLQNESIQNGDLCITTELALLGNTIEALSSESDPCPCRLRPATCHD